MAESPVSDSVWVRDGESRRLAGRKSFPCATPETRAPSRTGPRRATGAALAEKFCDP